MFENILTKKTISFKDLEEIAYKMYLLSKKNLVIFYKINIICYNYFNRVIL